MALTLDKKQKKLNRLQPKGKKKEQKKAEKKKIDLSFLTVPVLPPKDINLYKKYTKSAVNDEERLKKIRLLLPIATVIVIGIISSVVLLVQNVIFKGRLEDINGYLNDGENIKTVSDAQTLMKENSQITQKHKLLKEEMFKLDTFPMVSGDLLRQISMVADAGMKITVKSYTAETGELGMSAVSSQVINIPDFIKRLDQTGFFSEIEYEGYDFSDREGGYSINVVCTLSENAGKTTEQIEEMNKRLEEE